MNGEIKVNGTVIKETEELVLVAETIDSDSATWYAKAFLDDIARTDDSIQFKCSRYGFVRDVRLV